MSAQCHLVFSCANILKHLCSIVTSSPLRQWYANLEGQRSRECERGTHECVRHNAFNILRTPHQKLSDIEHECLRHEI